MKSLRAAIAASPRWLPVVLAVFLLPRTGPGTFVVVATAPFWFPAAAKVVQALAGSRPPHRRRRQRRRRR